MGRDTASEPMSSEAVSQSRNPPRIGPSRQSRRCDSPQQSLAILQHFLIQLAREQPFAADEGLYSIRDEVIIIGQ
jgi:hypothetical protein